MGNRGGFGHHLPLLCQIWGLCAELQGGSEPLNELLWFSELEPW